MSWFSGGSSSVPWRFSLARRGHFEVQHVVNMASYILLLADTMANAMQGPKTGEGFQTHGFPIETLLAGGCSFGVQSPILV